MGAGLLLNRQALKESGWIEVGNSIERGETQLSSGGNLEMVLRIRQAGYELGYTPKLKRQHYIPEKRMSANYLSRLHRSLGESPNFLLRLAHHKTQTWAWRMGRFYTGRENLMRQIFGVVVKELLLLRPTIKTRSLLIQRAI